MTDADHQVKFYVQQYDGGADWTLCHAYGYPLTIGLRFAHQHISTSEES